MTSTIFLPIAVSAETLTLATWNVRILSDGSRTDQELIQIAEIMARYDFIAVQEVRDTEVLDRLMAMLAGYDYIASEPVGRGVKEIYAFVFNTAIVDSIGAAYLFPDPGDLFIREPFVGHFESGDFDFTVITIHLLYGDSASHRRGELVWLDEVLSAVDAANGPEDDVLFVGDYNFHANDRGWQIDSHVPLVASDIKTTITDTSSYDNIWINPEMTVELLGGIDVYLFDEIMFGDDDDAASLAVSDHRPVSVRFRTDGPDDDDPGTYDRQPRGIEGDNDDSDSATQRTGDVRFERVVAHPTNEESMTLRNYSDHAVDISGWVLGDKNDPNAYRFPSGRVIEAEDELTIPKTTFGFGINNSAEVLILKDPTGVVVDSWSN